MGCCKKEEKKLMMICVLGFHTKNQLYFYLKLVVKLVPLILSRKLFLPNNNFDTYFNFKISQKEGLTVKMNIKFP
jgi:hypothetical protein